MSRNTNSFFGDTSAQNEDPCDIARKLTVDFPEKCVTVDFREKRGRHSSVYDLETFSVKCPAAFKQLNEAHDKCWHSISMKPRKS